MSSPTAIIAEQLPINRNFKLLKEEGFAYIQANSGYEWTNLNASDPGVTILEQVCYALTELGYCNDFPIADILTKENGKLITENQFYLPEEILTTAPVTIADYRKYIIDGIDGVINVVITPIPERPDRRIYHISLLIDPFITQETNDIDRNKEINEICTSTFFYLNKCRNVGEIFLMPAPLKPIEVELSGTISIKDKNDKNQIEEQISEKIRNYIFPSVSQVGYEQLVDEGLETNEIFNGPLLKNGWIATSQLGENRNQLQKLDLFNLIITTPGVISLAAAFDDTILIGDHEIFHIKLSLTWHVAGANIAEPTPEISKMMFNKPLASATSIVLDHKIAVKISLPKGKYRDIDTYYSIQNTFPEIFAVGEDAVTTNAEDFQIAQSRQLKGYLTLFDQVLANQFSQLANVNKLFSFQNSSTGSPSAQHEYYAVKDEIQKEHPEYPVPYLAFAPTYFYQSLYKVPHIRPLLKDHNAFKYSVGIEPNKELEKNSWMAYKQDPYNSYMKGLMDFLEDDTINLTRRNDVLDHLLARHGESPLLINTIIDGSIYTSDDLKDQLIFKSLYLQNLGLLSYYRQKAYNFLAGTVLKDFFIPEKSTPSALTHYTKDFLVNSSQIDHIEKLTELDFINYSVIELKLSLLFGLKPLYHYFLTADIDASPEELGVVKWLHEQRKGFLLIEMGLLGTSFELQISSEEVTWTVELDSAAMAHVCAILNEITEGDLISQLEIGTLRIYGAQYQLKTGPYDATKQANRKQIGSMDYYFSITAINDDIQNPVDNSVKLIFPNFIPALNGEVNQKFVQRLAFFMQQTLPIGITYSAHFVDAACFLTLIPVYVKWHNALIYKKSSVQKETSIRLQLADLITDFNLKPYE